MSKATFIKSTIAAGVIMGLAATAQAEVSANIGATSNYVWRGVSQSGDSASVSGGIDYANDSGFYAGTWVGSLGEGSGGETDFYLGFGGEAGSVGYDVGYIYYAYTEFDDIDFGEIYGSISVAGFDLGLAYTVNNGSANDGGAFVSGDMYYSVGYGFDLSEDYSLGLTVGHYAFDEASDGDYTHFQADIATGDFTFSISKAQEESGDDDVKFIVSWGTSF